MNFPQSRSHRRGEVEVCVQICDTGTKKKVRQTLDLNERMGRVTAALGRDVKVMLNGVCDQQMMSSFSQLQCDWSHLPEALPTIRLAVGCLLNGPCLMRLLRLMQLLTTVQTQTQLASTN